LSILLLYLSQADTWNHLIRYIVVSSKTVSTLAGTAGVSGAVDGVGVAAKFNTPTGVAIGGNEALAIVVRNIEKVFVCVICVQSKT
jgi:hypothetical protein